MVFAFLTKVVIDYMIITSINVRKTDFEKMFIRVFYSRKSSFYYNRNNVLYILI